jgi:hypothetical protein
MTSFLLLWAVVLCCCMWLPTPSVALSREEIEKKLKEASGDIHVNRENQEKKRVNDLKAKLANNKNKQKLKQDVRNAKKLKQKDIRKAKRNGGEL